MDDNDHVQNLQSHGEAICDQSHFPRSYPMDGRSADIGAFPWARSIRSLENAHAEWMFSYKILGRGTRRVEVSLASLLHRSPHKIA
jgi:hypothetical protein